MTERKSLTERALAPIDIAWLAAFRILFGIVMCVSMLRFIGYGWIDPFFVRPTFHFKYWGFAWVEPLSGPLMHGLFYALAALGLCVALGLFFRVTAWAFALGFAYLQLIDVATYLNHYYLATLLAGLLALSPAHRAWSIDCWLFPSVRKDTVARAWLWLLRLQVGVVYTFAGLAKASSDWLVHAQPLSIWLGAKTDMPVLGALFSQPWAAHALSWGGFLFDSTIVLWLLARRTRPYAYAVVIVFHALTRALFPIGMFPVIMVLGALVFFEPTWPRTLLARVRPFAKLISITPRDSRIAQPRTGQRVALAAGALYCLIQVAVPLRFLAYDGSVLWHEQGMRFSWRVMVREKNGSVSFIARDRATGKALHIAPRRYLSRVQEREMSGQPDLILQLAHHIHDQLRRERGRDFALHAEALVSLNGRRSRALIDPEVDLSRVVDGLTEASFISPSPDEAPPHLRPAGSRSIAKFRHLARNFNVISGRL